MAYQHASAEEVTSAIYIDMPNVERRGDERLHIRWPRLFEEIEKELAGTKLIHAGAYSGVWSSPSERQAHYLDSLGKEFGRQGFEFHTREAKDIDSWIVNDLWMSVARTQELTIREKEVLIYPLRLKHILVSGDGGYLRAYRSLKKVYEQDLEIEVVVFAWRNGVNQAFHELPARIVYLDDIDELIKEY